MPQRDLLDEVGGLEDLEHIDRELGRILKTIRKEHGFSQMELAERIGISFQQIQKYEKGATRISVSRLWQLATALGVEPADFLNKGKQAALISSPAVAYGRPEGAGPLGKDEILLLKLFRRIRNKKVKEGILQQLRGTAELEKQLLTSPPGPGDRRRT